MKLLRIWGSRPAQTEPAVKLPAEIEVYAAAHGWCPPDSAVYNQAQTDLVTVVMHELGHGLGFATYVDDVAPVSPTECDFCKVAPPEPSGSFGGDAGVREWLMANKPRLEAFSNWIMQYQNN